MLDEEAGETVMNTERHYLQEELYDLNCKDHSILDFLQQGSLDGLWYWDIENPESEWMSPGFWNLLGFDYRKKKHLASEWQDLIHPDDLKVALKNFTKHCEDPNHPYDQVVRYLHQNGSTVWVRCRGIAIRDKTGKPVRMLGAHTDLTLLKQTEAKLREKSSALQQINRELELALNQIKTLRGILPICSSCKRIRAKDSSWTEIEAYIKSHSAADFTHSMCPDCASKLYPDVFEQEE